MCAFWDPFDDRIALLYISICCVQEALIKQASYCPDLPDCHIPGIPTYQERAGSLRKPWLNLRIFGQVRVFCDWFNAILRTHKHHWHLHKVISSLLALQTKWPLHLHVHINFRFIMTNDNSVYKYKSDYIKGVLRKSSGPCFAVAVLTILAQETWWRLYTLF